MFGFSRRHRWMLAFMLLVVFLSFCSQTGRALGADIEKQKLDLKYEEPKAEPGTGMAGAMVRLILSLAVIVGSAWLVIRLMGKQMTRRMQGEWIQVLDEVMIGPNRGIMLCEVGGKVFAVGVTDHQVATLFEVTDEALIEDMIKKAEERKVTQSSIPASLLWERAQKALNIGKGRNSKERERYFHSLMQEELRNLERLRSGRDRAQDTSGRGDDNE